MNQSAVFRGSYTWPSGPQKAIDASLSEYIEQSRTALDSLRLSFERERAAFAEERKLWGKERSIMQRRISELERNLGHTASAQARASRSLPKEEEEPAPHEHHVWEGSSPKAKPTRIFPDSPRVPRPRQTARDSASPASLDDALSPRSRPADHSDPISVPIEWVDRALDGINIKSTALRPDVAAKMIPPQSSLHPTSVNRPVGSDLDPGKRKSLTELPPPVGHLPTDIDDTPMAPLDLEAESSFPWSSQADEEQPFAPRHSLFPPASLEVDPIFPEVADDPALKGPLNLRGDEEHDMEFFEELDQKLLEESKRNLSRSTTASSEGEGSEKDKGSEEPDPEIKFRRSTNFGTAFGSSQPD